MAHILESAMISCGAILLIGGITLYFYQEKIPDLVVAPSVHVYSKTHVDKFECPRCHMSFWGIPNGRFKCQCKESNDWEGEVTQYSATARHLR